MKFRNMVKKYGAVFTVVSAATIVGPAHAADIDITEALTYFAAGLVAAGALTAAMMGLTALIGVGKQARRAGT